MTTRPFKVLGIQQVAIGGPSKAALRTQIRCDMAVHTGQSGAQLAEACRGVPSFQHATDSPDRSNIRRATLSQPSSVRA
mgnify:CR=1 FL=1